MIPPSPEVIEQESRDLKGLYRRAVRRRRKADYKAMASAVALLADDPERALRVSLVWAQQMVVPIRSTFDLSDPKAGIYLTPVTGGNSDPEEGELVVGRFVNLVLREDYDLAKAVFEELVRWFGTDDLQVFLSLLLALSCPG